ncbi:GNAT family N-acetyltransferase [Luteimicrobium xylanilyticum]|uniref:tRNA (Guanine(37)-N(1))-methyltransferase n=1 Tax=Luteimicrobium xylanilyticum TaxID=1133546 RepID=A0A5P9QEL2_9MICO|nr:GNAT family N-acetyltransferase [Luteimicrobium xylanilyticum]QFU98895.1 tRNA (guanine(37)-N(1))-methyltransferase [Luteimicrobium xylanilyticum]
MPDDLTVRLARTDDVEPLVALAAETFPDAAPPTLPAAAIAEHVARELDAAHFRSWVAGRYGEPSTPAVVLVAETDGRLVGYALLVRARPAEPAQLDGLLGPGYPHAAAVELSKIYALASARGTGATGTLMTAALVAAAELLDGQAVWLGTNTENRRAQRFYGKHGFAEVGRRAYVVGGEPQDDVVMARVLRPARATNA